MNTDIRVALGFFDHRKTRKLIARFGIDAAWGLLRLWAFAAESRPVGYITNMSNLDITMECHLEGKVNPDEFVAFMKSEECRWIDETESGLYLHDWHIHNPWACGSEDRSDTARFNRMAQSFPKLHKELCASGVTAISKIEYNRLTKPQRTVNEPLTSGQPLPPKTAAPYPSPTPSPTPSPAPESKDTPPAAPLTETPPKKKTKREEYIFEGIPEWINQQSWDGYLEMRKKIRSPLTDWGKHLTVLDLDTLRKTGQDPSAVLNQSSQKSWRGVFKVDGGGNGKDRSGGGKIASGAQCGGIAPAPGEYEGRKPLMVIGDGQPISETLSHRG